EQCKELWKQRLEQWKKQCLQLREHFPALNYFRFNEVHTLIHTIHTLVSPNCSTSSLQASKFIKPFLQKINCQATDKDVDNILHDWKYFDSIAQSNNNNNNNNNDNNNSNNKDYNDNKDNDFRDCKDDIANSNELIFELLALFESQRFIPRAEHVLVCNEKTTEEDVTCLIFRAITNYIKTTPTTTTTTT
ncbi:hypothetical protein RFI_36250, partial [Reticulomyxa filosa]